MTNEFSHTNAAERVHEDMTSAITALNFLTTSIGQLAALHEANEEEAIITEGRVIAAKREVVRAVTGLLEVSDDCRAAPRPPRLREGEREH